MNNFTKTRSKEKKKSHRWGFKAARNNTSTGRKKEIVFEDKRKTIKKKNNFENEYFKKNIAQYRSKTSRLSKKKNFKKIRRKQNPMKKRRILIENHISSSSTIIPKLKKNWNLVPGKNF